MNFLHFSVFTFLLLHFGNATYEWGSHPVYEKAKAMIPSYSACPDAVLESVLSSKREHEFGTEIPFGPLFLARMFGLGFYVNGTTSNEHCSIDSGSSTLKCRGDGISQVHLDLRACSLQDPSFPEQRTLSSLLSALLQFTPKGLTPTMDSATEIAVLAELKGVLRTMFGADSSKGVGPSSYGPSLRFYGRMESGAPGGGIFAAISTLRRGDDYQQSYWRITLDIPLPRTHSETVKYSLQVRTLWADFSPSGEPSRAEAALDKASRINTGSSVALSGIGTTPTFIMEQFRKRYRYGGLLMQLVGDKSVYIVNAEEELCLLFSWDALVQVVTSLAAEIKIVLQQHGWTNITDLQLDRDISEKVYIISSPFYHSFRLGEDIKDPKSVDFRTFATTLWEAHLHSAQSLLLMPPSEQLPKVPRYEKHQSVLVNSYYDFREHVQLSNFAMDKSILEVSYTWDTKTSSSVDKPTLPLCTTNIKGYWRYEERCASRKGSADLDFTTSVNIGEYAPLGFADAAKFWKNISAIYNISKLSTWYRTNVFAETLGSACQHTNPPHWRPQVAMDVLEWSGSIHQRVGPTRGGDRSELWKLDPSVDQSINEAATRMDVLQPSRCARVDGAIWQPESCQMIQYRTNSVLRLPITQAKIENRDKWNMPSDFSSHCDTMRLLASQPIDMAGQITTENTRGTLVRVPSLAAFSLFSAGIGMISGFGDSLGDEHIDNLAGTPHHFTEGLLNDAVKIAAKANFTATTRKMQELFPKYKEIYQDAENERLRDWAVMANGDNGRGVGVRCAPHLMSKLHKLDDIHHDEENDSYFSKLGYCIENTVPRLFDEGKSGGYMESPVYDADNDKEASPMWLRQKIRKVALVTNFMCQHSSWHNEFVDIVRYLEWQAEYFKRIAQSFKEKYDIEFQRIFVSSNAVHGFVTAGLTPARQERFNELAVQILQPAGWTVLDAYNISLPRPDMTIDGLHTRGGASKAITDVILNMLTNEECG